MSKHYGFTGTNAPPYENTVDAVDDSATVKCSAAVSGLESGARVVLENDFDLEGELSRS